jgi:Tfp pilus assembly pilus retraction ATPase PilT
MAYSACLLFLQCLQKGHLLSTLHTQSAVHALDWVSQGPQQQQQQPLSADLMAVCCARQIHFFFGCSQQATVTGLLHVKGTNVCAR